MYLLDVEPLDLGPDVRAVGLELVEADENREPVRGQDAARIWSRVLPRHCADEALGPRFLQPSRPRARLLQNHDIDFREAGQRFDRDSCARTRSLESLLDRFQNETFGARAGALVTNRRSRARRRTGAAGRRRLPQSFPELFFLRHCGFEDGSLVLLSEKLWASEVIRRVRPALEGLDVENPPALLTQCSATVPVD